MSSGLPGPLGIARVRRLEREGHVMLPPGYLDERVLGRSRQAAIDPPLTYDGTLPVHLVPEVAHHPDLLGLARQVLGAGAVPVSAKVHVNAERGGTLVGDWHRDQTWSRPGGPQAAVSVVLVLETFEASTGLVAFVPRSHRTSGSVGSHGPGHLTLVPSSPVAATLADDRLVVGTEALARLVQEEGVVAPPWSTGAALVFDPRLVHTGVPNQMPFPVRTLSVTYAYDLQGPERTAGTWDCPVC